MPPPTTNQISRRTFVASTWAASFIPFIAGASSSAHKPRRVAAILTDYYLNSHADVIAGRWMQGFELDGKSGRPASQLVSMFTDQVNDHDISRKMSKEFDVPIFPTIAKALSVGGDSLAVDGVLLIGEHGNYPYNEKGQHLYPRRRFFEETAAVFANAGRSVPVFSDKHLSYSWENAKWMYDRAVELKIPFMAGSSLPGTWRLPPGELTKGTPVSEAMVVAHGGVESYGFHALETLQCIIERRKGAESGVRAVTCLEGDEAWKAGAAGHWSRSLLDETLSVKTDMTKPGRPEDLCKNPAALLIEYRDGLKATVLLLNGFTQDFLVAARIDGQDEVWKTNFWLQPGRPHGHFSFLVQGIEKMIQSGRPSWPVERTLLTTGILDAVMTSRFEGHRKVETPWLTVAYQPGPAWKQPPAPATGPQMS